MIVEELISKLGLEIDPEAFKTLEEFQHAIHHGLTGITVAAGAAAVAFAALIGETAEAAAGMGHTAEVLGENVERLQELKYAADRNEISFESLTTGLGFLNRSAREAADGNLELRRAFGEISLRGADGKIKSASDLLEGLAERFEKLPDAATRTDYAMKLLGRGGRELLPMLQNSEKLKELIAESHKFGNIFTEEDVTAAKEFNEGLKDVRDSLLGLRNGFATQFFEDLAPALRALSRLIISLRPYVVKFGLAIRQTAAEFWGILKPIRQLITYLGELFSSSAIASFLKGLDTFAALKALMLGLSVAAGLLATEFLISAASAIAAWIAAAAPFILLAGLIGLIIDDIQNFIDGNDSMIGRVQKWANAIGDDPEHHPIITFLRRGVALMLDLTDPSKWDRFANAAVTALAKLYDALPGGWLKDLLVGGAINQLSAVSSIGKTLATGLSQWTPQTTSGVTTSGGLLDTFGFQRRGFEDLRARGASPAAPNASFAAAPSLTAHVTINGTNLSPEQLQSSIENALNASYSSAQAATSGGEK